MGERGEGEELRGGGEWRKDLVCTSLYNNNFNTPTQARRRR
jgi:hypothetical protein